MYFLGPGMGAGYLGTMKHLWPVLSLSSALFVVSVAFGAVPPISVTVSDDSGKVAFKGSTNANGTFTTPNLKPGNYVVQFNAKSGALKGHYSLVISTHLSWFAADTKVSADDIAAERFAGAGVAMRITVGASVADTLKKHPEFNNPAAIRAMERDNKEANFGITGQVTAAR